MVIVFALSAAVLYGGADFLGGAVSRRTRALSVLTVSAPVGAILLLAAALAAGGPVRAAGLPWAVGAGAAGGVGLIMFYVGLAAGPMRVVAPVSALVSTVLPLGVAVASGERPGPLVYAGGIVCVAATALVSTEAGGRGRPSARPARGFAYAVGAGLAFGLFFLFLRNAGVSGVLWPSAVSRVTGAVIMIGVAAFMGAPPAWRGATPWLLTGVIASGLLDATANACYLLATQAGLFGIAVVLTSLYPAITVLLARLVLGERLRPVQLAGLVLAVAGIALVSG
ncbi:MAG TPA: EamA family transporter [Streptosporangiaceae bacterium]|nr:EamA family transporter [Streptosporangiaceae bacterium]